MRLVNKGRDQGGCWWLWGCWRRIFLVLVWSTAAATACECGLARSEGRFGEQLMIQGSNSGHLELWYRPENPSSATILVVLHYRRVIGHYKIVSLNQTMWTPDTKDTTDLYRHISINYTESEDVTRVRGLDGKHHTSLVTGFQLVYALVETDQPVDWITCACNTPTHPQASKYNTMLLAMLVLVIVAVVVVASWRTLHYYRRAKTAEHSLAVLNKNIRSCEE